MGYIYQLRLQGCSHTFHTQILPCGALTNTPALLHHKYFYLFIRLLLSCLFKASAHIAKCIIPHLSCLGCTLPPCPHSQADGHLKAATCHSYPLSMCCTCSGVLCNTSVCEPLNMPCICNVALPLRIFCHLGMMMISYS